MRGKDSTKEVGMEIFAEVDFGAHQLTCAKFSWTSAAFLTDSGALCTITKTLSYLCSSLRVIESESQNFLAQNTYV